MTKREISVLSSAVTVAVIVLTALLQTPPSLSATGLPSGRSQEPSQVPTITSIDPPAVTVGGPDFTLTVSGTDFMTGILPAVRSVLRWNGADRTTIVVSSTLLTALIPAADITH